MSLTIDTRTRLLDGLATLIRYPGPDHQTRTREAIRGLSSWQEGMAELLSPLSNHLESSSLSELEETYTRTFDIQPDCALEVGWHLYGENYTRGSFLVQMRTRMRELGLEESAELPDHLGHVLEVVARLPEDQARELCRDHVIPALVKMREKLPEERPHACVLQAAEHVTRELFSIDEELTTGKEALPYFREIDTIPGMDNNPPPGCTSECGGMS